MILSNGPPGSSLKALYFIFQLYVKSMASKINCQSSTTSFVTLQRIQILSLFFCFLLFLRWKIESTSHDPSSSSPSSFLSATIRTADFKIDPCHPDDFHFNLFLHLMEGRPFAPGNHSCVSLRMMINWRAAVNKDKKKKGFISYHSIHIGFPVMLSDWIMALCFPPSHMWHKLDLICALDVKYL